MTDGSKKQHRLGTQHRSRIGQGIARLLEHPRMAGVRGALDTATARLERFERRLPPPLKNPRVRQRLLWVGVVVGGIGAVKLISWQIDRSLPDPSEIQTFARRGTLTMRASDGTILHQLGPATREKLTIDQMPKRLVDAFIASEDRRFYEHKGIDYQGIVRAIARNITSGGVVEGGSTLTQQLSRIVYLNNDRSIIRKIREALIAQKLERSVDKRQLLEKYLNLIYLGSNAYGVGDAAWIYFSKSTSQLTLSEMATIAGLPPAPSVYSPLENPEKAKQRRNNVLDKMVEAGYISTTEAQTAKAEELKVKPSEPKKIQSDAPYFTYYVQQQLPNYVSKEAIAAGGLTIETTLNAKWQKAAEKAIKDTIEIDGSAASFKQASLVAIDPRNGEIRSMVGGYDFYKESQFNRATQAQRQPGSTFKPFVYTAAIAAGFSPYQSYLDERFKVDGYQPKNYSNKYSGWMTIKSALTKSVNVIAVKTLIDIGFAPVIKMAQSMGIHSKLEPTYAMALGAYEVNLLELTNAYGTLAAQGNAVDPHGIRRIVDRKGKVLYQSDYKQKRVLDPGTASIMTWMMRGVVTDGTGRSAQLDRPVAGKTGTSEKARDLWFIGFIPQVVAGVWLGNDDNSPTWGASSTAAFTWHEFMKEVVNGMPVQKFPEIPENLDTRKGSIKAQPVKPSSSQSLGTAPDPAESRSESSYEEAPAEPSYEEPSYSAPSYAEPEPERAYEPEPEPEAPALPQAEAPPPESEQAPDPAPAGGSDPLPPSGN
ncbi:MAG: penicillin-binding protein 1A [Myxacorys californica WJT36-NPBG1]|nr:penicillin-binding protein 1A [Myxacorys californica WJT36-NPBG1]